ncbi:MAG: serine hydrolase [Acidobacteria bacterium]|nr:serine hydrolase [Acidobacteriota bacterium]
MTRKLLIAILTVSALVADNQSVDAQELAVPESVGMSASRLNRLTDALDHYAESGQLSGGVAMVMRRGEAVFRHAFGVRDLESGAPMHGDSIFRIASQTKAIVSVAVMLLHEEGKLLISDRVGKYMPEYAETTVAVQDEDGYAIVPAERPITIRDLLTHTAGVGYGGGPGAEKWAEAAIQGWYFAHLEEPIRDPARRIAELPFESQPGDAFVYGYSTDILGALVEVVAEQPLDLFLAERIFEPLGMKDTHSYLPESKVDRLAVVYVSDESGLAAAPEGPGMFTQGQYVEGPRQSFSGGAGLLSAADDYARFLQMTLNGGELDGVRLLSPKTVELMTANHVGDKFLWGAGTGFGLGFSVLADLGARGTMGTVGEYAWGGAYHSAYWVDPAEELVVVYFTQIFPAGGLDDHARLRALVYQAIVE